MDPNAALAEFRKIVAIWEDARAPLTEADRDRAIELARDLDGWITRGGFLPRDWVVNRHRA